MQTGPTLDGVISSYRQLIDIGVALHWLHPNEKRPIGERWSEAERHSVDTLRKSYVQNANIGVRLGKISETVAGFLHVIDLDIRKPELAQNAWDVLLEFCPEAGEFPTVISGSGGESRHIYFFCKKPFDSRKLAKSDTFSMVFDPKKGREVRKNDWEIDLFGTGKQVVLPPSIHPDTGLPYEWETEFDTDLLDLGIAPSVAPEKVQEWGVNTSESDDFDDDDDLLAVVKAAPLGLSEQEITETIANLPEGWVEDRDTWLQVGAALHHEYSGSQIGFDRWCNWSKTSAKFEMKTQKTVWKSFKGARNPIRMATLIQAAGHNKLAQEHDWMSDLIGETERQVPATIEDQFDDLFGDEPAAIAEPKPEVDWLTLLQLNDDGEIKSNLPNLRLIFANDPRTAGIAKMNEFTQEIVVRDKPGFFVRSVKRKSSKPIKQLNSPVWKVQDPVNGDLWIDSHDHSVREVFEAQKRQGGYNLKITDRDLRAAVDISAQDYRFHPVQEYLLGLKWDGVRRMDTMFIDFLGCPDTPYHRGASRLTLLGAVTRVFEPGHKFDFVPILEGVQGKGKSTFINILGHDWANELTGDIADPKAMIEVMQGQWIMEIGELSSMARAEVNELKAFVSRTHDKARLAWEKRAKVYPRQCIFIGSTNDSEYLRDQSGGRRFWPIKCSIEGQIDNVRFAEVVHQIWAEAYETYIEMRKGLRGGTLPLYLAEDQADAEAKLIQESRRVESAEDVLMGQIMTWLDEPIGTAAGFDDLEPDAPAQYRTETCILQVWREVLHRDGMVPHREAMMIGKALAAVPEWYRTTGPTNVPGYGKVRAYRKGRFADEE